LSLVETFATLQVSFGCSPFAPMLATPPLSPPRRPLPEQRVVFRDLSWESYQQILQALGNKRSSRLSYDDGALEITMPFEEHEWTTRLFDLFIRVLVTELGLKL